MSKWKCEICNSEFDNFQAQGFNHKIYCPLCYFKELNIRKDKEIQRLNNIIQSINSVCSSMQFSAPENMYIHLQRMIEVLDYWKKGEKE